MVLVGYWPLDESSGDAVDYSGNKNDGVLNGGVTQGSVGVLGKTAYSFDGSDDYISVGHDSSISLNSSFTINLWVYLEDTASDRVFWLGKRQSGKSDGFSNYYISGPSFNGGTNLRFNIGSDDWRNIPIDTVNLKNKWSMVTFVFKDKDKFEAYLNGSFKGSSETNASPNTNSGDLEIGRQDNGGGRFNFNGKIQHVRIYNHALTG